MPNSVVTIAAEIFNVTVEEIMGPSRRRHIVLARHAACYAMRQCFPKWTLWDVSRSVGRKNHASTIYAVENVAGWMAQSAIFKLAVESMIARICVGSSGDKGEYNPDMVALLHRLDAEAPEAKFKNINDMMDWLDRA